MKCPFCLEEIIDGAKVCRFCGRKQPLTAEEKKKRKRIKWPLAIGGTVVVIVIILAWAALDSDRHQRECEMAARVHPDVTVAQCLQMMRDNGHDVTATLLGIPH